jgi:diacylglycerol kinase family enzyme
MRLAILANPAASGFSGDALRRVTGILRNQYEVDQLWPSAAGGIEATVRSAIDSGADVVAAMGGDGVAHHAAEALVGTSATMALIPVGTTNVLARILGIPANPVAAAEALVSHPRPIDLALARLQGSGALGTVDTIATFSAGMGLDADIVRQAEAEPYRKYRMAGLHYLRTTLRTALGSYVGRPASLRVDDGDRRADGVAVLVQVHEPYTYLGPFPLRLAPRSPASLAVLILEEVVAGRIPQILASVLSGRRLGAVPGMTVWTGVDRLNIAAEPAMAAQTDGESLGLVDRVEIKYCDRALTVLIPG